LTSKSDQIEQTVQIRTAIQTQIDSVLIYKHDSIYIRDKNDTVFVEKWHTKIAYRDRVRSDTLHVIDTVRISDLVEKTVEVEVNRITGWQRIQIYAGRVQLIGILLLAIYTLFKVL
jgi:hypothetical protein